TPRSQARCRCREIARPEPFLWAFRLGSAGPEPGRKGGRQPRVRELSHPGHITVRPDQHGARSRDRAEFWKLPLSAISGVDQLNSIRPCGDVEARFAEVEEHGPGAVQ